MHAPTSGPQGPGAYPCLVGRSVIVTGGAQGIGACMALALAERGAKVVINAARDTASLDQTVAAATGLPGEVRSLVADIRDPEDCERVVRFCLETFGSLHALINNAARGIEYVRSTTGNEPVVFWKTDQALWAETIANNVTGTFFMSAAAASPMVTAGFGRIINVSTSDRSMVRPRNTPYGPSKAALEAMTVAWAKELQPYGVTANVLLPGGATRTRMATGVTGKPLHPPDIMNTAVLWLCSDRSSEHSGGRYIATEWDSDAEPDAAALGARQPQHDLPVLM